MEGGECAALNQHYKSVIVNEVFNMTSKKLNVNGSVCEFLDKYFEMTIKH